MPKRLLTVALLTDSRLMNRTIERALEPERFFLRTLSSETAELLDTLKALTPDFLFLNSTLKETSGMDLRNIIRKENTLSRTKIIFLSPDGDADYKSTGLSLQSGDYLLQIPFTASAVSQFIASLSSERKTILYADDTKFFHNVVVPPLREEGYNVIEAWDGKEALDILSREKVDMVVTDVEMPEMDGFSLCKAVRTELGRSDLPVLIATSLDSEADVSKGFEAGADDYITKPIVLPELLSRVKRMLKTEQTLRPERILVVDDSRFIRNMVCQSLRSQGFQDVDEAEDGQDALSKVLSQPYSLVISDYQMPQMDGYDLSLSIRQNKKISDIPIIMVSDRESKAKLVKIRSTGIQAFIAKPFVAERLIAEVERVLADIRLQQQKAAMRHYLSDEAVDAVDRIVAGGKSETFAWDKFRTILFMDVVGFTPLCEKLSPREVVDLLNVYFEKMVEILIMYDAIIDKFIGDAIFAVFGRDEDGAHRAICCAYDMINALPALRAETGKDVHVRIGINSGHVVVGDIGSRLYRRDFTVIGDNVNTAQRLESAAPKDGILISESAYALVKNIVKVEATEPLKLKGKQALLQAYRVKFIQPYEVKEKSH